MKTLPPLLCLLVLLMPCGAYATIESYEFDDEAQRLRFQQLAGELRCPKCQNQNIADSNAPIAADLRREIHRMLREQQSDRQIVDFMSSRYGDFVLYKPRLTAQTLLLWGGPPLLLLIALALAGAVVRRYRGSQSESDSSAQPLSDAQRRRLKALLQRNSEEQ